MSISRVSRSLQSYKSTRRGAANILAVWSSDSLETGALKVTASEYSSVRHSARPIKARIASRAPSAGYFQHLFQQARLGRRSEILYQGHTALYPSCSASGHEKCAEAAVRYVA